MALRTTILVAVVAALVAVPSALAAGSVSTGNGGQGGETQGSLGGAQGGVASLPFTGTELTLVLLFGVALLISGLALRRFSGARP